MEMHNFFSRFPDNVGVFVFLAHMVIVDDHFDVRMIDFMNQLQGFSAGIDDVAFLVP